jgi:hypothetical protein
MIYGNEESPVIKSQREKFFDKYFFSLFSYILPIYLLISVVIKNRLNNIGQLEVYIKILSSIILFLLIFLVRSYINLSKKQSNLDSTT